ncbi:F-box domain containing protein [Tanacetum coccineum]
MDVTCHVKKQFRLSVLSSQTLEHLSLRGSLYGGRTAITLKWELPYLTTLHLHSITLYDDNTDKSNGFFSKCTNLKNLTLSNCKIKGSDGLSIFHLQLSNLALDNPDTRTKILNVVAPQLKTLSITGSIGTYQISTPQLVSLLFKGDSPLLFATYGFHSLEKARICYYLPVGTHAPEILSLLQQLHNVKFLTINLDIVKILSSSVELHSHQTSAFSNLKSLWILPMIDESSDADHIMSAEIKSYFLKSSLNATLTLVPREECIDILPETSTAWLPSS